MKDLDEVAAKQREIMIRAASIAIILATLAALFQRWPVALGVLAGCFFSLLNFRLLALGIVRVLELTDPKTAQVQAVIRYIIRYIITIGVLYTISVTPSMDFFAAVIGILLIKAVILGEAIISYLKIQVQKITDPARWERGGK